jgi:hypothetical protein
VRWQWWGEPPEDAEFVAYGRLVSPKGNYDGCESVPIYYSPQQGYGYKTEDWRPA